MNIKPIYLIVTGALILIFGWLFMDVTVSTEYGRVVNVHKIKNQEHTMLIGGLIFIAGIILQASLGKQSKILDEEKDAARAKIAAEKTEKLKNSISSVKNWLLKLAKINDLDRVPMKHRLLIGAFIGVAISLPVAVHLPFPYGVILFSLVISLVASAFARSKKAIVIQLYIGVFISLAIAIAIVVYGAFALASWGPSALSQKAPAFLGAALVEVIIASVIVVVAKVLLKRVKLLHKEASAASSNE